MITHPKRIASVTTAAALLAAMAGVAEPPAVLPAPSRLSRRSDRRYVRPPFNHDQENARRRHQRERQAQHLMEAA